MPTETEERLNRVEAALADFMEQTTFVLQRMERDSSEFKAEMLDFKDDMKDFKNVMLGFKDDMKDFKNVMLGYKDDMKDFKDDMKDFKDEMKDFKDEMKDFKDEMLDFKDEMQESRQKADQERREMNKQWGDLANKMGTIVEDIIAPGTAPAVRQHFGDDILYQGVHIKRKDKKLGIQAEFDVVCLSETTVYLVESKVSPDRAKLIYFKDKQAPAFRALFPEYADKKLVLIFGALRFEPELVAYATSLGVYMLAYREWEYLDILNFDDLAPLI